MQTTARKPYYRQDTLTKALMPVDILWIAKATGHVKPSETKALALRLDHGEVMTTELARFAKDANLF